MREALAIVAELPPFDIVLAGMRISGEDGVHLGERLCRQFGPKAPPVVILSDLGSSMKNSGFIGVSVPKPVKDEVLLGALLQVAGRRPV